MCTPAPGLKGAHASLRDGLRPPLTPDTDEQGAGYRVDGPPMAGRDRAPPTHPGLGARATRARNPGCAGADDEAHLALGSEKVVGSIPTGGSVRGP